MVAFQQENNGADSYLNASQMCTIYRFNSYLLIFNYNFTIIEANSNYLLLLDQCKDQKKNTCIHIMSL